MVDAVRFDKFWLYDRQLKNTSFDKKKKPASIVNEKPSNLLGNWREKLRDWLMKKSLKQMINKEKNRQIEIDKKPSNPGRTKEKNQSARVETDYNVFAFLFQILVVAFWPRFCLVVLVNGTTKSQAIGEVVSDSGKVAISLLRLSL